MDAKERIAVMAAAAVVLLALACVAGVVFTRSRSSYRTAQAQWMQQRPRHYAMDATWHDGLGAVRSVHVEVRNGVLVAGTDRATGRPLSRNELAAAARFVSIDSLFDTIATAERRPANWHDQVARAVPPLASWISPCVTPRPEVRYDPALGYPASLELRTSPCTQTFLYSADMTIRVAIEWLEPLP